MRFSTAYARCPNGVGLDLLPPPFPLLFPLVFSTFPSLVLVFSFASPSNNYSTHHCLWLSYVMHHLFGLCSIVLCLCSVSSQQLALERFLKIRSWFFQTRYVTFHHFPLPKRHSSTFFGLFVSRYQLQHSRQPFTCQLMASTRLSVVVFHHCYSCWPVRCIYVFLSLLLFVGYYLPISLWLDLEEKISFIIRVRYSSSMDLNRCYALPPSQQLLQGGCCSLLVSSQERFSLFPCTFVFSYRF